MGHPVGAVTGQRQPHVNSEAADVAYAQGLLRETLGREPKTAKPGDKLIVAPELEAARSLMSPVRSFGSLHIPSYEVECTFSKVTVQLTELSSG